jgi:hypothetical protein
LEDNLLNPSHRFNLLFDDIITLRSECGEQESGNGDTNCSYHRAYAVVELSFAGETMHKSNGVVTSLTARFCANFSRRFEDDEHEDETLAADSGVRLRREFDETQSSRSVERLAAL